jgi:uncharacterized phage protein gp47/JayE
MPIETRTFDEMYALGRALIGEYIDDPDLSEGGDYDITARLLAAMFTGNQGQVEYLANQLFPSEAAADFLEKYRKRYRLPDLSAAQSATGIAFFTATSGTPTLPAGATLTHVDGTVFVVKRTATAVAPSWIGKTVVDGSTASRLLVAPDAIGIAAGQVVEVNGERRSVGGVDLVTAVVDLSNPLPSAPPAGVAVTAVIGGEVAIDAQQSGSSGQKPRGDELTIDSPPANTDAEAFVVALSGGTDGESEDDLRARITSREQSPPASGNAGSIRGWVIGAGAGAIDALVYPGFRGLTAHNVIPIGPQGARVLSQEAVEAIQANVDLERHPSDDILVQLPTLREPTEVQLVVTYETGFEPDWSGSFRAVSSPSGSLTRVDLTSSPVGTVEVGDRIMIDQKIGAEWFTFERTVTAVDGGGLNFAEALPVPISENALGTNDVFPGSPNAPDIVAAIESVFDGLGAGVGEDGTEAYFRDPLPSVAWDPVLRTSKLEAAVIAVPGVRDVALTTIGGEPAADLNPEALGLVRRGQIRLSFVAGI